MPSDEPLLPTDAERRENYNRLIPFVRRTDPVAADWMNTHEARKLAESYARRCLSLDEAFIWRDTPQGFDFWDSLHRKVRALMSFAGRVAAALTPEYRALVANVRRFDPAAADYLLNDAPKLPSFAPRADLGTSFAWCETPQGKTYWSDLDLRYWASRNIFATLSDRMSTWPKAPVWRDDTRSQAHDVRAELAAMRGLINDYIKAHLREPDRIDVLGDLYYLVMDYTAHESKYALQGKLETRLPVLRTFHGYAQRLGYSEAARWRHVTWAHFGEHAGFMAATSDLRFQPGNLPWMPGHMVHVSVNDPLKVAYTKSLKDMLAGRQPVILTPGRLIRKLYPYLTELQVKGYAEAYLAEHTPVQLKIARSASEIVHAVGDGPSSSCMANRYHVGHSGSHPWFKGHVHPAAVYGHCDNDPTWDTDIEVLYFEKGGEVKARVICNAVTKACARIYGDEAKLRPAMEAMGYTQETGALVGARIRKLDNENQDSSHIIPYIDAGTGSGGGQLYYYAEGERHWMIGRQGNNSYRGYENNGVSWDYGEGEDEDDDEDRSTCDCCGDRFHDDTMTRTYDGEGDDVCEACLDAGYIYAVGRGGACLYVRVCDAVRCESDSEMYHVDYLIENDVYEATNGNCYKSEDLVSTSHGDSYVGECTHLDVDDVDGNSYAEDDEVMTTHDGRKVHCDETWTDHFTGRVYHDDDEVEDDDEVMTTHDGRQVHCDETWTDHFTGMVYHADDEVEDDDGDTDELLRLPTVDGRFVNFLASSMFANLDRFYVIGNVLTLRDLRRGGSGKGIERGAIPLTEYLLTYGPDCGALRAINNVNPLPAYWFHVLDTIHNTLTETKEETTHDELELAA